MKTIGPVNASIKTLMIVDDCQFDHQLAEYTIEQSTLVNKVVPFLNPSEALDFLAEKSREIDVLMVDLHMPVMNGFEFLQAANDKLKEQLSNIVVVMLSSSQDPNEIETAKNLETIMGYFPKPLTVDHLRNFAKLLKDKAES